MKYLILGAGGTGGALGFALSSHQKDVTLLARGEHLAVMKAKGLTLHRLFDGTSTTVPVKALSEDEIVSSHLHPDVILVCVKYYSLTSIVPLIRKVAVSSTIVLPILNVFGTGEKLQEMLPDLTVLDGCIYVSAEKSAPGELTQHGPIFRVVFGEREPSGKLDPRLHAIEQDFTDSGITPVLSSNVRRDCLEKFSYVSALGAAGLYFHAHCGDFQKEGKERDLFISMIKEIAAIADAMGCGFEKDIVATNLQILSGIEPSGTTSMQQDVAAGRSSEVDGLVYQVVERGHALHVPVPSYEMVAKELRFRSLV